MKTIGQRVQELRRARGFARQGDLGQLVGVDQSVISDIERGSGFKAEVLMGLCKALETTPEYLMYGVEAGEGEAEIIAIFRKTNPEGRAAILAMARGVQSTYPRVVGDIPQTSEVRDYTVSKKKVVADTVVHDYDNSFELTVPDTKKDARRATSSTTPAQEPPERSQHTADSPKARRVR